MHVITGLQTGGAERMLANLCILACRSGRRPIVVSLLAGGSQYERLRAAGVQVLTLGMSQGRPSGRALLRLARFIREERPDVVQSWMYHADLYALFALWLSGRRRRTRLFWGVRCSDMNLSHYGLRFRVVVRLCALLSRFTDGIAVNSRAGLHAHRQLGYETGHMVEIDNGFDTDLFKPDPAEGRRIRKSLGIAEESFVIGTIARVDVMKDFDTLRKVLERLDDVVCVAVGNGTESIPPAPGLKPIGERTDVPALLNAFDALVSVSAFGEGFSNVIGEAMASGLPVVATDVGDARRIVGDAGRIVPPRDVEALADAIRALRDSPESRAAMGETARQRIVDDFSLRRAAAAFDALHGIAAQPAE